MRRLAILVTAVFAIGGTAAYGATVAIGSWHLWAGTQTLTKGTCTVSGSSATTDTYVDSSHASNNFGNATTLQVKPDGNQTLWTFVRFDLSSCSLPTTGGADSATLKLFLNPAPNPGRTLTVTPVLSTWSQTLTWTQAQRLSYGAATTTFATGNTNGTTLSIPVTVDVDALIKSSTASYGWRISDTGAAAGGDKATFTSANASSNVPQLVISYEK
ncbi:MAG TPA: DNRLRE domain-containing protein [Gaiellaceae bacterium]|nr:DNRLRE domain-containing protein [Gaiellaceae bacterium]